MKREELFQTAKGISYQCDSSNLIFIEFGGSSTTFRIQDFLNFRRILNGIDIQGKLYDLSDECDYEDIEAPKQNAFQRLTLCEVIQLRELVNGTYFGLQLNSLLHELLYSEPLSC